METVQFTGKDATMFQLLGKFGKLTTDFFDKDPPTITDGNERSTMLWRTTISDSTDTIPVTVWDKACYQIFGLNATDMLTTWAKGVDATDEQEQILDTLNAALDASYRCACSVSKWKQELQVSVNVVESEA